MSDLDPRLSSWDYRLVRVVEDGVEVIGLYDRPVARTMRPAQILASTVDEVVTDLQRALEATTRPVLDDKVFEPG